MEKGTWCLFWDNKYQYLRIGKLAFIKDDAKEGKYFMQYDLGPIPFENATPISKSMQQQIFDMIKGIDHAAGN